MGETLIAVTVLGALLAFVFSLDYRDANRFSCLFVEDRDLLRPSGIHGYFQFSEEAQTYVNRGEREVCVEDIVNFANRRRMGSDGEINTADDAMTLEQQIDMVNAMLEANFHGGYWVASPWYFQYSGGTPVLSRVLYSDTDEVVTVSGSRTPFNGMFNTGSTVESLFLLEGALRLQRKAPLRGVVLTPLLLRNRASDLHIEAVGAEGELWRSSFRMKKGKQLLYAAAGEGAFFLHHYSGSTLSIALWEFVWPCLLAGDLRSAWGFASAFGRSFYRNGILPVAALLFKKDEAWSSHLNASEKETTAAVFSEEVYAEEVDTGEEDAVPAFQKRMKLLREQNLRAAIAQRRLRPGSTDPPAKQQQQRQHQQQREKGEKEEGGMQEEWTDEEKQMEEEGVEETEREKQQQERRDTKSKGRTSTPEERRKDAWTSKEKWMKDDKKNAGDTQEHDRAKEEAFLNEEDGEDEDEDEEVRRARGSTHTTKEAGREEQEADDTCEDDDDDDDDLGRSTYAAAAEEGEEGDAAEAGRRRRDSRTEQMKMNNIFSSTDVFEETLQFLRERIERQGKKWPPGESQKDASFAAQDDNDIMGNEEL